MDEAARRALREWIGSLDVDPTRGEPPAVQRAVHAARILQERARELQTAQERRQQAELDRIIQSPHDRATLIQLTDQAFRSRTPHRAAEQMNHILDVQGIPRFFSPFERALLLGFQSFGDFLPGVTMPLVRERMQRETANVILPAEPELLAAHLAARREQGLRMNVNYLGEAVLGEAEAERRLQAYLAALQQPEIEVVSVKISTISSQIHPIAREHTIDALCDRLELLYRAAHRARFRRGDGSEVAKFVYLDMEEYRDMELTADAFTRTLERPGLERVEAGIALQAYLPDAFRVQRRLENWARRRRDAGGAAPTLRLVKGANLEMERVEASLRGWPQAPYKSKAETDANWVRMLESALRPKNAGAVRVGVASHNLFDLAYGLVLAAERDALDRVQVEMLEGMANHVRRAVFERTGDLLLYAPAARKEDFVHAIAYLFRRLDENTGPENFLRHAFRLRMGSEVWERLERGFLHSFTLLEGLSHAPRRTQDRRHPPARPEAASFSRFVNEPDTDWSLPHHAAWAESIVEAWRGRCAADATEVPLVIDGSEVRADREEAEALDPSRPGTIVARARQATIEDVERAVACARADPDGWRARPAAARTAVLRDVAQALRCARAQLLGAALAEGAKLLPESDPEVSEAVDFVELYAQTAETFQRIPGLAARGRGVVAVVSPWNFPISIPCGGIAAALAAGNTVILKPAPEAVLVAWELCRCFWDAGVSRRTLQLVPGPEASAASHLVKHDGVDVVVLTGGTDTARALLRMKPTMRLLAETGGKNATIVTALADRDLAIRHVIHSAFSHGGQKCSATSLLLLEDEVYEDAAFRAALCDAAASLTVGPAWDLRTQLAPLIRAPAGALARGLKELEPGESWALRPEPRDDNPQLWSPGIKWDVSPGSFTHRTELFGPVLGVMRFRRLGDAIERVNETGYGLTSGLESLDEREQELWSESVRAGNLYVNRPTVGAVVLRQPFGGMGLSAFGAGIQVGGPNTVVPLMEIVSTGPPQGAGKDVGDPALAALREALAERLASGDGAWPAEDLQRTLHAVDSYDRAWREEFGRRHDSFRLLGQDNWRLYRPLRALRVRLHPDDGFFDLFARVCAARAVGCRVTLSVPPGLAADALGLLEELTEDWAAAIEFVEESDGALARVMGEGGTERLRLAAPERVSCALREASAASGCWIADAPVLPEGRIELLWYLHEQSLSIDWHRYGNLGARAGEERAEPE